MPWGGGIELVERIEALLENWSITLLSWWHFHRYYLAQAQRHIAMWSNAIIGETCSEDWFVRRSAAFVLAEAPTRWNHWLTQCAKILPRLRAHCIGTILAQVHRWSGVAEFGTERRVVSDSATDKNECCWIWLPICGINGKYLFDFSVHEVFWHGTGIQA